MRTPQEYVDDMTDEVLPPFMNRIASSSVSSNDQYHAEVMRLARRVGLNPDSLGFKASMLLACDLFDGLASSLQNSEVEDKEIGSHFIREAAARLRVLSLWGSPCNKKDCLDLR